MTNENIMNVDENAVVKVVKDEEGKFHVIDADGTMGPACTIIEDGRTISLSKNAANRQYCAVAKANTGIEKDGYFQLTVRTTPPRKLGDAPKHLPNAKLISYLSEEDQAEYKAIIDRAIAAREAEREAAANMSDKDRLLAKIAKLQAKLNDME